MKNIRMFSSVLVASVCYKLRYFLLISMLVSMHFLFLPGSLSFPAAKKKVKGNVPGNQNSPPAEESAGKRQPEAPPGLAPGHAAGGRGGARGRVV